MLYIYPDFYSQFRCIASKCKHTCCAGWEIDIDVETLSLYKSLEGDAGKELLASISEDGIPHFKLGCEMRCPHLNNDNLCTLILKYGEGALCDICAEHPRFYNVFGGRTECGLGLCCEAVVDLLLKGTAPLQLVGESDDEDDGFDCDYEAAKLLNLRQNVLNLIKQPNYTLHARLHEALKLCGVEKAMPSIAAVLGVTEKLEFLSNALPDALAAIRTYREIPDDIAYERLAEYFVYRHFSTGGILQAGVYLWFCVFSVFVISLLATNGVELPEAIRLYSSEIEYSDENIDTILKHFFETGK